MWWCRFSAMLNQCFAKHLALFSSVDKVCSMHYQIEYLSCRKKPRKFYPSFAKGSKRRKPKGRINWNRRIPERRHLRNPPPIKASNQIILSPGWSCFFKAKIRRILRGRSPRSLKEGERSAARRREQVETFFFSIWHRHKRIQLAKFCINISSVPAHNFFTTQLFIKFFNALISIEF